MVETQSVESDLEDRFSEVLDLRRRYLDAPAAGINGVSKPDMRRIVFRETQDLLDLLLEELFRDEGLSFFRGENGAGDVPPDRRTPIGHPNIAELYRRKVQDLQTLLEDESSRPQAMEIMRSMVDRIEVSPGTKRGEPEVLLVGALASILDYAATPTKNAASYGDGVGRVLMVAGVGFEPTTFRL